MKPSFGQLYLPGRFFIASASIVLLFGFGFVWPLLFSLAKTVLLFFIAITLVDLVLLLSKRTSIKSNRLLPRFFSLGDENEVIISVQNNGRFRLHGFLIDEIPENFQKRDFKIPLSIQSGEEKRISYLLKPLERGAYVFHDIHYFASTPLGLVQRRFTQKGEQMIAVYPSVFQMKKMELRALSRISHFQGIKKMRRLGHSYEFEQIKNYVQGDDIRSINWKATGRRAAIMVNQYEDERAQQVYAVIDKSRSMKLPFKGMSLLDYAINTSLAILNIALQKYDKAGLITFSDKLGKTLKADRKKGQLNQILETLYTQKERNLEPNYEQLYYSIKKRVAGRSLLLLFSNFESQYTLERVIPILRKINYLHLLVVIFFENTEMIDFSKQPAKNVEDIYLQAVAQNLVSAKYQMVQTLHQYGIQTILSRPEDLSINTVNKYLELKSRGLI